MGMFTSDRARRDGRVTVVQLFAALMSFVVLSVMGGFLLAGVALPAVTAAGSAAHGTSELFEELPEQLQETRLPQQSNIYARDGETLLATFYDQNRTVVPLEEISPWLQKAVVSIEDRRFWLHNGVDGEGLIRALYVNATRDDMQGASTLTQQLVKNILLQDAINRGDSEAEEAADEVSVNRKIREMRLAMAFEDRLNNELGDECTTDPTVDCGKEEVLQQYLNIAQFGPRIYGVETAAQYYFSKPASEVNAIEAATIAGVTQNPSRWDPTRVFDEDEDNYENATIRRNQVLTAMHRDGHITDAELSAYTAVTVEETLNVSPTRLGCATSEDAPFFCDYVTKIISSHDIYNTDDMSGAQLLEQGGLEIVTTLDIDMQRIANEELLNSLPADNEHGFAMAMVATDPNNGEILSMAQNRVFDPSAEAPNSTAINYTVDRQWGGSRGFSPGSTFKPVVLAEWLNTGRALNQVVSGSRQEWTAENFAETCHGPALNSGEVWRPGNVGGTSAGQMSVLQATARSINTAYAAMASQLDMCDLAAMAETLGFERSDGAGFEAIPSSTLGTQNASPLTMAEVYQTFANRGVHCESIAILSITDAEGNDIEVPPTDCNRVISEELADGVTWALQEVMTTGSGRYTQLDGRPSAGKTGTAQDNTHTWFAGYTPQLLSVFWLGHPDRDVPQQFMTIGDTYANYFYGSTVAAPTWEAFMERSLEGAEVLSMPGVSDDMLYGVPIRVPDVTGRSEYGARLALNEVGFSASGDSVPVFSSEYEPGTVVGQSPAAGTMLRPGNLITLRVATDQRPGWWDNWPQDWDRNVAPDDYWGSTWPPSEFSSNPPNGWVQQCVDGDQWNEDTGQPCPGYEDQFDDDAEETSQQSGRGNRGGRNG